MYFKSRAAESEETYDMAKDGNARSGSTSTIVPSNIGSANEIRGTKTKKKGHNERKDKGETIVSSKQFLNQVSYQQNHVPMSSGSMTQIFHANEVSIIDESESENA
ncbi:hypothetical protein M9H77_13197 [Catharanthus roseus]|uniref:Uncharacterized protein n=1 Tax=Catharanthus roseus TaxID=4058 RepID=A0ACC0BJR2_CATRO|nr:hypothetical protein M9H77_13197 [Catharanthus roseus]